MVRNIYFTNRKEYYRRKKISIGLKRYWAEKKLLRIRKQVCMNELYGISARAIIINGKITKEQLEKTLMKTLEREGYINLFGSSELSIGYEEEELDSDEDSGLKDGVIYIEINQRGIVTLYNL